MSDPKPYVENESHVPDPTDAYGTLDTSGTAGSAHGSVETVTSVFQTAADQDAVNAAKAIDPKDDSVHPSLVVLPDSARSNDEAVKVVKANAQAAKKTEAKPEPEKAPAKQS